MSLLLVDADIVAFKYATRNQDDITWEEEVLSRYLDLENAKKEVDLFIEGLRNVIPTDKMLLCFTGKNNFRYTVDPTYKGNRKDVEKPALLGPIREYLEGKYNSRSVEGLEADDLMGIMATQTDEECVIASIDKDLKQIPCKHYNWDKEEFVVVTSEMGHRFFVRQIISGDPTDGYYGCPQMGGTKAEAYLDEPYLLEPYEHVFSRGKRKGEIEIRYEKTPLDPSRIWEGICSLYAKHGLDEAHVIRQARMAKILQVTDVDFNLKPILWTPEGLTI